MSTFRVIEGVSQRMRAAIRLCLAVVLTACVSTIASAQLSEGPNDPGAAFNDPAFGTPLWTDPTNAQTSDNADASAAPGVNNTQYLHANNFGFAVPSPAVIVGIEVNIERRAATGLALKDTRVRIVKGGVIGGTERGDLVTLWPTVDTVKTYGSDSDLWGETWTAADINANNFGVVLSVNGTGDAAFVDSITAKVYYELCTQAPLGTCRAATKSLFLVKDNGDDTKDKTLFKWIKGAATDQSEFADPKTSAVYAVCVYEGGALSYSMIIPPSNSLWQTIGSKGFKYKDLGGSFQGVQKIILKGSADPNKSKVLVKGRGLNVPDPVPALTMPVEVQVVNSDTGICWGAEFTTFKKNQAGLFKAKNP